MVLQKNAVLAPFLSDRLSFIRGLDPLGLQNTSQAAFSYLLPGLNNVTGRIRYYSFYCWLLDAYAQVSGSTNPEDQKRFIRRAELIVALVACYAEEEIGTTIGTRYAGGMVQKQPEGPFDLESNTFKKDGSTEHTYWKYPTGGFGQYYLGSLRDIGIIVERAEGSGVFIRSKPKGEEQVSGEELAHAFEESVPEAVRFQFLKVIKIGLLTIDDIYKLLPFFRMDKIAENSLEQDLLIRLLIHQDYPNQISEHPSTLRRQTIKHLLDFAANTTEDVSSETFIINAYQQKGIVNGEEDECLTGWYYYQLNEYWQFGCLAVLNGALQYLEALAGPGWWPINDLLETLIIELEKALLSEFDLENQNCKLGKFLSIIEEKIEEESVLFVLNSIEIIQATNGFTLALKACWANQSEIERLIRYGRKSDIVRDGDVVSWAKRLPVFLEQSLSVFLHNFLWKDILQRHQLVAYRKMNAGQSTQKFILEEQRIRLLGTFPPGFTGPRINRMLSFLFDLHLLDEEYRPTALGSKILNQIKS